MQMIDPPTGGGGRGGVGGMLKTKPKPKELAKLDGMTEWFLPKEIDEMQVRLNKAYLEILQWRMRD